MSLETAWYRGRTITGLQVGEPYPSTQVVFFFSFEEKNYPAVEIIYRIKAEKNNISWLIKKSKK